MKSRGHLPWCHVADDVIHHLRKEVYRIFFNIAGKSAVSSDDLVAGDLVTNDAGRWFRRRRDEQYFTGTCGCAGRRQHRPIRITAAQYIRAYVRERGAYRVAATSERLSPQQMRMD